MASPERVQEYLKHHKIGVLFEDLMAKVIADMPDDPVIYLARILNLKAEKRGARNLKTSGHFDSVAVAKKSFDKPWSTNSKRQKPKETEKTGKKTSKPDWDHSKKPLASSFDDLWDDSRSLKKSQSSPLVKASGMAAWADSVADAGEDVMFSVYGYRGPHRQMSADPLADELKPVSDKRQPKPTPTVSLPPKKDAHRVDSSQHKMALEKYIKESEHKSDSGIDDEKGLDSDDDAIELLEDLEELKKEGVKNVKQSGVKVSRNFRQHSTQAAVRVSICARCAKVMGGGVPSEAVPGVALTDVTGYDSDVVKDFPSARVQSDDEEFESVSQVTGPRRPVWQDSDNEGATPRIFSSGISPTKSAPAYSSEKPKVRGQKAVSTLPAKSSEFHKHKGHRSPTAPLHMTWSPSAGYDSTESENKQDPGQFVATETSNNREKDDDYHSVTGRTTSVRSSDGAWQLPPDFDTDSSFYGSPGASKPMKLDRAY